MKLFFTTFWVLLCNTVAQFNYYNVLNRTVVDQLQIQSDFSLPTKQVQLLDFRLATGEGETIQCRGENLTVQEIRFCGTTQYGFSVNAVGNGPDPKTTVTIFYEICRDRVSTGSRIRGFPAPGERLMMWDRLRLPRTRHQRIPTKDRIFELQLSTAFYFNSLPGLSPDPSACATPLADNDNKQNSRPADKATQESATNPQDSETVAAFRQIVRQVIREFKSLDAKLENHTLNDATGNSKGNNWPASIEPSSAGVVATGITASQSLTTAKSGFVFGFSTGFNYLIWKSVESALTGFTHNVGESGFKKAFEGHGLNEKDVADAAAQEATVAIVRSFGQLADAEDFVSKTDSKLLLSTLDRNDDLVSGASELEANDGNPSKLAQGLDVPDSSEPSHSVQQPDAPEPAKATGKTLLSNSGDHDVFDIASFEIFNGFTHEIRNFSILLENIVTISLPSIDSFKFADTDLILDKELKELQFYFNFMLPDGSVCGPSYWFNRYENHELVRGANKIHFSVHPGRWTFESISGWNETKTLIRVEDARSQPGKLACK